MCLASSLNAAVGTSASPFAETGVTLPARSIQETEAVQFEIPDCVHVRIVVGPPVSMKTAARIEPGPVDALLALPDESATVLAERLLSRDPTPSDAAIRAEDGDGDGALDSCRAILATGRSIPSWSARRTISARRQPRKLETP